MIISRMRELTQHKLAMAIVLPAALVYSAVTGGVAAAWEGRSQAFQQRLSDEVTVTSSPPSGSTLYVDSGAPYRSRYAALYRYGYLYSYAYPDFYPFVPDAVSLPLAPGLVLMRDGRHHRHVYPVLGARGLASRHRGIWEPPFRPVFTKDLPPGALPPSTEVQGPEP